MLLSKKLLLIFLICSIILAGLISYIDFINSNQIITQDDLQDYIKVYLDTYINIIEQSNNLTELERNSFKFYEGYPYSAFAVISANMTAIEFIKKSNEPYKIIETNEGIQESIFPITPNNSIFEIPQKCYTFIGEYVNIEGITFYCLAYLDSQNMTAKNVNGTIFLKNSTLHYSNLTGNVVDLVIDKNSTLIFDGVSIITKTRIIRQGNIILKGILIDRYNNIVKGSNLKIYWSRKKAEQDATDTIFRELGNIIIAKSELKGLGFIELRDLEPIRKL